MKLSVFCVFAGLFPEAVGENGAGGEMLIVSTREDVPFLPEKHRPVRKRGYLRLFLHLHLHRPLIQ